MSDKREDAKKRAILLNVTIVQSEPKWLKNAKNKCL